MVVAKLAGDENKSAFQPLLVGRVRRSQNKYMT